MNRLSLILSLAIFLVPFLGAQGQVTADFTSNVASGCSPLSVTFQDLSTGNVTGWLWDFGNANTSTLQNPIATYSTPGTYTITLTVTDGTNSDTKVETGYITVFQNPSASFTATTATAGCAPLTVTFNDLSVQGDGAIIDWIWDFGDGTIDNSGNPNPTHTYATPGTYPVSLQVTDANGCTSSFLINSYVSVSAAPTANFSLSPTSACLPPLDVTFTDLSSSSGPLTYDWNFGDGNTSTQQNPQHTYTALGQYNVTLTVTDNNGCSNTYVINNAVSIIDPIASFTVPAPGFCVGEEVFFTNTSQGGNSYVWDYDNGNGSTAISPSHIYNAPGSYDVSLIVSSPGGCSDTVVQTIIVEDITAAFSNTPTYNCQDDCVIVDYTDLTTNAVSWFWHFGIGTTSTVQNPSELICLTGEWTDTLFVTSQYGCTDEIYYTHNVINHPIESYIVPDSVRGCIPLSITFGDSIISDSAIVSWEWDFGNGNTASGQNPTEVYTVAGEYTVQMIVTNSYGCIDTALFYVEAGTLPQAGFIYPADTVCWDEPVVFCDTSQPAALVDELHWYPNNNEHYTDSCPSIQGAALNTFITVEFIAGYNGCFDTITVVTDVYTVGPRAQPSPSFLCANPFDFQFNSNMADYDRFYWTFGDGSGIDSINPDPPHSYGASGDYDVVLTTFNDSTGCDTEDTITVIVRDIQADFTFNPNGGCSPVTINFDGTISIDESNVFNGGYSWDYDDGGPMDSTAMPAHIFYTGVYDVQLVALADNGCRDTLVQTIVVTDPIADFTISNTSGCIPHNVTFTDNSFSDTTIVSWEWFFGDGNTSTLQNPTHSYTQIGSYGTMLIITDASGCVDTFVSTTPVQVTNPIANFLAFTSANICVGDSVWFVDFSNGTNLSYDWDFGDGGTSTAQNPTHTFNTAGTYSVTLTVTDPSGCDSTLTRPAYINVQDVPNVAFTANNTTFTCYPALVNFSDLSVGSGISSWYWDFGDNASSVIQNPSHNYTEPGVYDVTLVITTTNGCTDSITIPNYIVVDGPVASFIMAPDTICRYDSVFFQIDSSFQVSSYSWDFGDGAGAPGVGTTTSHVYTTTGFVYPSLIYSSSNGCQQVFTDTVYVWEITAGFALSDSIGCAPFVVDFTDQSTGANTFNWDFGDQNTSTNEDPQHTYNTLGTFDVSLVISSNLLGCVDTAYNQVIVYAGPDVDIIPDPTICLGDSIQLWATGGGDYVWTPAAGLSDDSIANPYANVDTLSQFTVTVTDTNGCIGSDSVVVTVQQPAFLPNTNDTTIIIGEQIFINLPNDPNLIYTWTPSTGLSCDDCPNPTILTLEDICYTVVVEDVFGCFRDEDEFCITVDEEYTIDVPNAFTPNGDGVNDIVYVRGWGIKELESFKIYNRWGQLVFESNDLSIGWDGYFRGELQNMETYIYVVDAILYSGNKVNKKGNLSLLR